VAPSDAPDATNSSEALLAHNRDKSHSDYRCPNPRLDRALVLAETGEVVPIGCGRNGCPVCRRRNVQVTAAKMGLNEGMHDRPVSHAVLSTTRDWLPDAELREGWRMVARRVRRDVDPTTRYAWFREWTTGKNGDGVRRTHYHSVWALSDDDHAESVRQISRDVWASRAGAYSEKAHGWKRVWDAGGLTRYIAGLVGHHLKEGQAPPPGWAGRRFGTSQGYYAIDSRELDRQAKAAARDSRLRHHLEHAMAESAPEGLPYDIWDEVVTKRLEAARDAPRPRIVRIRPGFWD
jgi:hypothetical protein